MIELSDINALARFQAGPPLGKVQNVTPPPDTRLQVFLSYSRKDLTTAEHLRDILIARGFGAYLDRHDILPGEPGKERLAHLIEAAEKLVLLLSQDSVASAVCDWELNDAGRLGG